MNISLKEIVEGIKSEVADKIPELKEVKYTFDFWQNRDGDKNFPKLYLIANENVTFGELTNTIPLTMRFCDVSRAKDKSEQLDLEIKSDMIQVASKLMDILQEKGYFNGDLNLSAIPFDNELNDGLSGIDITPDFVLKKPCYNV